MGAGPRTVETVDVGEILDEVTRDLRAVMEQEGAMLERGPLPTVSMDRLGLRQVLANLVSNAVKFRTELPPRVKVFAEREPDAWRISVADRGIGIDPKDRERIFEIFRRLHPSERFPGTGLGLAICEKIVARGGGRMGVADVAGGGSRFWFTVPDPEE